MEKYHFCQMLVIYHWRKMPQVSFMLQQKFSCYKHVFVTWQTGVCHNKSLLVMTKLLSWQTCVCHNKNILLQQTQFCHDKSVVKTCLLLSRQKTSFVEKNTCLSRQNWSWQKWYSWQLPPVIIILTHSKTKRLENPHSEREPISSVAVSVRCLCR